MHYATKTSMVKNVDPRKFIGRIQMSNQNFLDITDQ